MLSALCAMAVLASAGPTAPAEVRSTTLAAGFDANAALISLRDVRTGRELLAASGSPRLFALELTRPGGAGQRFVVTSQDAARSSVARQKGKGVHLVARFADVGQPGVDVTCVISSASRDPLLRWRIVASLPAGLQLESVRFPIVTLAPRNDMPDAWVMGTTKGGVLTSPSQWAPGRRVEAHQPGDMAAAFGCYYGARGGFYTAEQDTQGYPKTLVATRTTDGVEVEWRHDCFAEQTWRAEYDIVQSAFAGTGGRPADWRDAADIYKRWAVSQPWCSRTFARRTDLPAWLKQGPAMVRFYRNWLANSDSVMRWFRGYWVPHFAGVPLIAAYWGWEKVDSWVSPDYFPVFPSDEQFKKLARATKVLGTHTFLWPSGYHHTLTYDRQPDGSFRWDGRAEFDATARPHAVVGRDGHVLIGDRSWLQGGQTATMCPGDPWTIAWFNRIAVGCAQRGAELVQVDQVVGGAFPACYSNKHGHPPGPGPWMASAFRLQLKTMLAACRRAQPGAVVCFEEPNEHFIQLVGIQDYRDWEVVGQTGRQPASVFNYLYHEYLPTFQSNLQPGNRLQMAWCIVTGQIPHLAPSMQVGPGPLLVNGGFDEGGAMPTGWDKVGGWQKEVYNGAASRDTAVRHGGSASLCLHNTEPGQMVQMSQNVAVAGGFRVGHTYRVSVWMKSGGTSPGNSLMLGTFAPQLKSTWSGGIPVPQEAGGWCRGDVTFTVPRDTEMLRIMLHMRGPGTLWLDDMKMEEIRTDGTAVEVARPSVPADHEMARQWVDLFHGKGRPYLLLGKMLHPPVLAVPQIEAMGQRWPTIFHNAFQAADGTRAVILVNATDEPQTGILTWGGGRVAVTLRPSEIRLVRDARR